MRSVFFGTHEFARLTLEHLERAGRAPVAVVCQPDRPSGRGQKLVPPPVKSWAQARGIEVLQPARQKDPAYRERLQALAPEVGLVASFGQLLPRGVLDLPRHGFLNVHPSLVPRFRGAAPIQWTLLSGDSRTGVCILRMTPRLDDGEVLLREVTPLGLEETAQQLHDRLAALGGQLLVRALERLEVGALRGEPQDEGAVVWAPALRKEQGQLDWTRTALELHNQVRGLQPWPGAFTRTPAGALLKVHRAAPLGPQAGQATPGQILEASGDVLVVQCGQGRLGLLEVQLEGKKRLAARAFLTGRPLQAGDRLG
ncbi:MAG TPA: methionyl-tRNA formyltransferase [Myxococcota bacterium]|nr:methionyl-tRNA formyltransferase [Myxococcota bacterium]